MEKLSNSDYLHILLLLHGEHIVITTDDIQALRINSTLNEFVVIRVPTDLNLCACGNHLAGGCNLRQRNRNFLSWILIPKIIYGFLILLKDLLGNLRFKFVKQQLFQQFTGTPSEEDA